MFHKKYSVVSDQYSVFSDQISYLTFVRTIFKVYLTLNFIEGVIIHADVFAGSDEGGKEGDE